MTHSIHLLSILLLFSFSLPVFSQRRGTVAPRVTTPTAPRNPYTTIRYPWKQNITATVFWIGEKPTPNNPTPNNASSWDTRWQVNYGGYDNPDKTARMQYRPKSFTPKLNPFYIALPYNDCLSHNKTRPEASRVIPWWNRRADKRPGKTACKGRWIQIVYGKKVCYAQWEDCGPFTTNDWEYVFGNKRPKNSKNKGRARCLTSCTRLPGHGLQRKGPLAIY